MKQLLSILIALVLTFSVFAQKLVYDRGYTTAGAEYTTSVTLDTAAGTSKNAVFFLSENNWYPFDINPLFAADTTGTVKINSDLLFIGTLYSWFNANVDTDSVMYKIKAYPGLLSTTSSVFSANWRTSATWGTAAQVDSFRSAGDFMRITNIYISATVYKTYPPEVIKIEYSPIEDAGNDDSTSVWWKFVYPVLQ